MIKPPGLDKLTDEQLEELWRLWLTCGRRRSRGLHFRGPMRELLAAWGVDIEDASMNLRRYFHHVENDGMPQ